MLNTSRHAPQALAEAYLPVIQAHGQSILYSSVLGAALTSPRSTIPNYAELMVALVQRVPNETRDWLTGMLRDVSWVHRSEAVERRSRRGLMAFVFCDM